MDRSFAAAISAKMPPQLDPWTVKNETRSTLRAALPQLVRETWQRGVEGEQMAQEAPVAFTDP